MQSIEINTDLETKPFRDGWVLNAGKAIEVHNGIRIGRMPRGTKLGKSTVMVFVPLPDGRVVVAELTMNLFQLAADVFKRADEIESVGPKN